MASMMMSNISLLPPAASHAASACLHTNALSWIKVREPVRAPANVHFVA